MSQRSRYLKHLKKVLLKEKIESQLPTDDSIVEVQTAYNTTRVCKYNHRTFKPIDKPYTFSRFEIASWKYIESDKIGNNSEISKNTSIKG